MHRPAIERLISGGQTGVDRGALDAAITLGLPHGGTCPQGRRAEDGRIPDHYALSEDPAPDYGARTLRNVLDSDATLILHRGRLSAGTALTRRMALREARPHLLVDLDAEPDPERVRAWLRKERVAVLNVAGPRESQAPGIGEEARALLLLVLQP
jgi:hypothetical protein